ncbi:MAG: hypothetical protein NTW17_03670 [Candidatus Pacearchaeota archaeon]|nr:hypothetical protein [Candidatus Pacearchaeota archaeon]
MVKEEIIEGLRIAVSKGESLEKAMTSFYNAGYKKEEIEQAAAAMVQVPSFAQSAQQISQPMQFQQKNIMPQPVSGQSRPLIQQPPAAVAQNVSDYGKKPSRKGLAITIVLFIMLLLLLGVLAAVILFKTELSNFFGSLFWRALF